MKNNNLIQNFFSLQDKVFEYFGYVEDLGGNPDAVSTWNISKERNNYDKKL